jgi:DNA-binding NarL/FixJ family response regulator
LTSRQVAILAYLAEGRGVTDIARELGYSPSTIKKEVHLTIRGCGARSRAQAVAVGIRSGII